MLEAIYERRSIRTFKKTPLKKSDVKKIIELLKNTEAKHGPFNTAVKFFILEDSFTPQDQKTKVGTYGFVKNPQGFIGGKTVNSFEALIDFGYLFESIILALTNLNIGTVWLGGTFKRKQFDHLLSEGEFIPAISPIGYIEEKQTLREKLIRKKIKANQRKPFETLFFDQNTEEPISKSHPLAHLLELVQLAPSASNKQPWIVTLDHHAVHFFLNRTPNYASMLSYDIQALDLGIAIQHFETGLMASSIPYTRVHIKDTIVFKDYQYILSFRLERTS